jgi:hypothetical protein
VVVDSGLKVLPSAENPKRSSNSELNDALERYKSISLTQEVLKRPTLGGTAITLIHTASCLSCFKQKLVR